MTTPEYRKVIHGKSPWKKSNISIMGISMCGKKVVFKRLTFDKSFITCQRCIFSIGLRDKYMGILNEAIL